MDIYIDKLPARFFLGRCGENEFRQVSINWGSWRREYPTGTLSVILMRPDGQIYPVLTGCTDDPVLWSPDSIALAVAGTACIELRLADGDVIGKSAITYGVIAPSLGTPGTPPEAVPDWVQDVAEDADRAEAARHAIEDMTVSAEALPAGSEPTVTKTVGDVVNLEFGIPVSGGGGGTGDYEQLENKPKINSVELTGNVLPASLHISYDDLDDTPTIPTVPVQSVNGQTGAVVLDAEDVGALPDDTVIPPAYDDTELAGRVSAIEGKETGWDAKYAKPSDGIPASDMAAAVVSSLNKADTALQQHQDISGLQLKTITDAGGYFTTDTVEAALQELGGDMAGKVNITQGTEHAGEFLVIDNAGNVTTMALSAWQGGEY